MKKIAQFCWPTQRIILAFVLDNFFFRPWNMHWDWCVGKRDSIFFGKLFFRHCRHSLFMFLFSFDVLAWAGGVGSSFIMQNFRVLWFSPECQKCNSVWRRNEKKNPSATLAAFERILFNARLLRGHFSFLVSGKWTRSYFHGWNMSLLSRSDRLYRRHIRTTS